MCVYPLHVKHLHLLRSQESIFYFLFRFVVVARSPQKKTEKKRKH